MSSANTIMEEKRITNYCKSFGHMQGIVLTNHHQSVSFLRYEPCHCHSISPKLSHCKFLTDLFTGGLLQHKSNWPCLVIYLSCIKLDKNKKAHSMGEKILSKALSLHTLQGVVKLNKTTPSYHHSTSHWVSEHSFPWDPTCCHKLSYRMYKMKTFHDKDFS